jgi:putative ABC transport system permease protein
MQLVTKQMRQRALSTWLTTLSVTLGVGLAIAILILYRQGNALFVQSDFGYDVIVGPPKGSPLQLVLNTVYQMDVSPGNVPYSVYEDLVRNPRDVKIAIPYAVGDSYKNHRIIGTSPKLFGVNDQGQPIEPEKRFEYRLGKTYKIAQGRVFNAQKFEAIIGSEMTQRTGLKIGDSFKATHGMPKPGEQPDEHDQLWTVVGVLAPTHTAADRVVFIPLTSFYAISEHEEGLKQQAELKAGVAPSSPPAKHDQEPPPPPFKLREDDTIELLLPKEDWQVSAILVKARSSFAASNLIYYYKVIKPEAVAVNPATTMREFFETFLKNGALVMLMIAVLVSVVAAVGILVSIYNSVSARKREIAILRALGATRAKILTLLCAEAGLIGLLGAVLGWLVAHGGAGIGSAYLNRFLGERIVWLSFDRFEVLYLAGVVALAVLAGLVPALKAYRTPVATNLVAS